MLLVLSAYCHCSRCQRILGCPFVATTHISPHVFSWSLPQSTISDLAEVFTIIGVKHRYRCKTCGTNVASFNEAKNKWSVWTSTLDRAPNTESGGELGTITGWEWARPTDHIFYGTRMLDVPDGLPKWEGYAGQSAQIDEFSRK